MKRMPLAISAYFKHQQSPHKECALEMRTRILEIIPDAKEIIKYGMQTFEVDGPNSILTRLIKARLVQLKSKK